MVFRPLISAIAVLASAFTSPIAAETENAGSIIAGQAYDFLNTIGVCLHIQHGQDPHKIAPLLKYTGIRNVRDAADGNYDMSGLLYLHKEAGVKIVIGPGSGVGDRDLEATVAMARDLHREGALLAIEGPNEPNNFGGLTYRDIPGGKDLSWHPVAEFQRDLYAIIKADHELKSYPVYSISEAGAQTDNCVLQFLKIPEDTETLMDPGTEYADFANCHNYMYHPGWPGAPHDNQVWNAADPASSCRADGLYVNFGSG
ncbi:MAG: hypothetical protein HDS68_06690 [Bacteroidales bacterium]|nr:hypothetical protein [Bacteroidales bacterium]